MFYKFNCYVWLLMLLASVVNQVESESYKVTDQIYMDIKIDGTHVGRIIYGLFGEVAPKTVNNFKHIALHGIDGKGYAGTNFLVAVKKVMILAGDIQHNNGSGFLSIYGEYFEDETFEIQHDSTGLLAMVNPGVPNSNGCMFLITTMATPWLNGKNVIFGKVLKGHNVVHKIEYLKTDYNDMILKDVQIAKCGEIKFTPFYEDHKNYEITLWAWIKAGWFPLSFSFAILAFFQYIMSKLNQFESFK